MLVMNENSMFYMGGSFGKRLNKLKRLLIIDSWQHFGNKKSASQNK